MEPNPFHYGSPVAGDRFAGRTQELAALVDRMVNGINVVVTAPRRYGKTSLLDRAAAEVTAQGGAVVRANLLLTPSLEGLAARLTTEAYHLPGGAWRRAAQALPEFLRRLRLRPTVTVDDAGRPVFAFSGGLAAADAARLVEDVYGLLAELAADRAAVLMLDEFQAVADLDASVPGLLKALADTHPRVALVLAGSRQHLMESLVLAAGAPLYRMAERLALGPIEEPVMTDFLQRRAAAGGREMSAAAAARIWALAGPIPYDLQRLAYEAFAGGAGPIDAPGVDDALARVVAYEAESHAERFARCAVGQRRVLARLAAEDGVARPQSWVFVRATGYANPAGVARAMRALMDAEIVVLRDESYQVADPFFRAWLRTSV